MRVSALLRLLALIFVLITSWVVVRSYISFSQKTIRLPRWLGVWRPPLQMLIFQRG